MNAMTNVNKVNKSDRDVMLMQIQCKTLHLKMSHKLQKISQLHLIITVVKLEFSLMHLVVYFADISKAFDKVPPPETLLKLWRYGIMGKTHKWIT